MIENPPVGEFLTKSQVAQMFQVSERTIEKWVSDGSLPAFHIGRTIRFDREAILKKIREQQDQ
jgi:excisionase family DNA binding protein